MTKIQNTKQDNLIFEHLPRPFLKERGRQCLCFTSSVRHETEFRILKLEFIPSLKILVGELHRAVARFIMSIIYISKKGLVNGY